MAWVKPEKKTPKSGTIDEEMFSAETEGKALVTG